MLAKRQMATGAIGMTCARLSEAELLVAWHRQRADRQSGGGRRRAPHYGKPRRQARVTVAVDHPEQVGAISRAAAAAGSIVHLLVEVDIGMGRCGVAQPAVELARYIATQPGVYGWRPSLRRPPGQRPRSGRTSRSCAKAAMQLALDTRVMLEAAGIAVSCVSGCSSATYDCTGTLPGVDEIQAGTYATMDRQYQRLAPEFELALTVQVPVISRPAPG